VAASQQNPLRFEKGEGGDYKPYILIRNNLWGLVNRAIYYDLMAMGMVKYDKFGVISGDDFFEICDKSDLT
jgi:hypothetical protein